jgi:hypothetical protein
MLLPRLLPRETSCESSRLQHWLQPQANVAAAAGRRQSLLKERLPPRLPPQCHGCHPTAALAAVPPQPPSQSPTMRQQ